MITHKHTVFKMKLVSPWLKVFFLMNSLFGDFSSTGTALIIRGTVLDIKENIILSTKLWDWKILFDPWFMAKVSKHMIQMGAIIKIGLSRDISMIRKLLGMNAPKMAKMCTNVEELKKSS